jgi:hypothetical protein
MRNYFFVLTFLFFSHQLLASNCDSIVVKVGIHYTPFHYWDTTVTTSVYNDGLLRKIINSPAESNYFYDTLERLDEVINLNQGAIFSKRNYYYAVSGKDSAILYSGYNGQSYYVTSGEFYSYDINNNLQETISEIYDTISMQWDTTYILLYSYSPDSLTRFSSGYPYPGNVAVNSGSATWDSLGRIISGESQGGLYWNSFLYSYDSICTSGFSIQHSSSSTGGPGGYTLETNPIWFYDSLCRPLFVIDTEWTYPSNPTPPNFITYFTNYYYADCNNIVVFGTDTVVTCAGQPALMNVSVFGGTGPYTFSWTSSDSLSDSSIQNPDVFSNSGTTCNLTVTDSLGNQAQFHSVVTVNYFTPVVTDATCDTCSNGSVELLFPSLHASYDLTVYPDSGTWNGNILSGLQPGTYILFSNSSGCDYKDTIQVHYPTAVGELSKGNSIHVYPNPAGDYFNVKIDFILNDPISLTLRSIDGRVLYSGKKFQTEFIVPVDNLASGIYFLEIVSGFSSVIKVIKE